MSSRRERLTIRAIGGCSIAIGKTTVNPDSAVLFALGLYMAVRAGRPTTRAELLEVFWPDTPEAAGRHSLRQMLYKLKRAGLAIDGDGDVLMLAPDAVSGDLIALMGEAWPDAVTDAHVPALTQVLPGYEPAISPRFQEWIDDLRAMCAGQIRRAATRLVEIGRSSISSISPKYSPAPSTERMMLLPSRSESTAWAVPEMIT